MHDHDDHGPIEERVVRDAHPERGATTLEWAGLGATCIAAIIVLVGAMQAAGLNIIAWIQDQLIG